MRAVEGEHLGAAGGVGLDLGHERAGYGASGPRGHPQAVSPGPAVPAACQQAAPDGRPLLGGDREDTVSRTVPSARRW